MKNSLWERVTLLVNGKAEWCDAETGEVVREERLPWRLRWAIAGIHSRNWKWVRKYGEKPCGCTINPVTRRKILIAWGCKKHGKVLFDDDCCGSCPCKACGDDD